MTGSNSKDAEIQCLDLGAVDFIPKPYNFKIVVGRINSVIKLRESVLTLTAVEHDELTGIYTRQAFFYHAKTLLKAKAEERFHLIVADIRDFKLINSSYGEKLEMKFYVIWQRLIQKCSEMVWYPDTEVISLYV